MIGRVLLFAACLPVGCAGAAAVHPHAPEPSPRRIVLFVADGAGLAYWNAARLFSDTLAVTGFPVVGLMSTGNVTEPLPESASAATALATGVLTFSGAIGVGPDSLPRRTTLEAAEAAGLATGLVTTTTLVDATPAAFAAHAPSRRRPYEIARQMVERDIEVLLGDGRRFFDGAVRPDSADLVAELRARGVVIEDPEDLGRAADPDVRRLFGFFDIDSLRHPATRRPTLAEMTVAALSVLDRDPDGFFLLVENEHTDHEGHENASLEAIATETIEVDRAARQALAYRERAPDTLILVVGDHETGGLAVVWDERARRWSASWATGGHTPGLVPIFAVGPAAERFGGVRSNAEVGRILLDLIDGG